MPQRIAKHQYQMRKDTTDYIKPFFKSGLVQVAVTNSDGDYVSIDTGVANFPNAVITGGISPEWVSAAWNTILRGSRVPFNGATNITLSCHILSGSAQNVGVRWWALGY